MHAVVEAKSIFRAVPRHVPSSPETEALILLEVAKELSRLADEAVERARAAFARIGRPLPLFDRLDEGEK